MLSLFGVGSDAFSLVYPLPHSAAIRMAKVPKDPLGQALDSFATANPRLRRILAAMLSRKLVRLSRRVDSQAATL